MRSKDLNQLFESMGFFGLEPILLPLMGGLLTKEPTLFIGAKGSGKTSLAVVLFSVLGLRVRSYSAPHTQMEDLLGVINPKVLAEEGRLDFVTEGGCSIWQTEAMVLDEVSRIPGHLQSKWLSILQEGYLMSIPLEKLQYIIATMNPIDPSYSGVQALDSAFASRFQFLIQFPSLENLPQETVGKIIRSKPQVLKGKVETHADSSVCHQLIGLLENSAVQMDKLEAEYGLRLSQYIASLASGLSAGGLCLDGRRAGQIFRGILAMEAIHLCLEPECHPFESDRLFQHLRFLFPDPAWGGRHPTETCFPTHRHAYRFSLGGVLSGKDESARAQDLMLEDDLRTLLKGYLELAPFATEQVHEQVLNRWIEAVEQSSNIPLLVDGFFCLERLMQSPELFEYIPLNCQARMLEKWEELGKGRAGQYRLIELLTSRESFSSPDNLLEWLCWNHSQQFYEPPRHHRRRGLDPWSGSEKMQEVYHEMIQQLTKERVS